MSAFRMFDPETDGVVLELDAQVSFRCGCGAVAELETGADDGRHQARYDGTCACGRVFSLRAFLATRKDTP